jgi:hypothetical protein
MNDQTTNHDQVEEEILNYAVSDEALESAGTDRAPQITNSYIRWSDPCCRYKQG